ncbi:unnamed protein product [Pocillopora meandrina]|uniref:Uncharacterized protein n=1 Tax=Pocillopora meandrina TaxID=46732 RepID=A0AAU9VZA4_9CNID|nr:unnamed protein product [Pocillopora meandrina]
MWTKLEGAVSAEGNEIVASKKFKERIQKPKETITSFVTDLMLLVKDCNYIDEDRQVRDQFVYGVSDDDLKKKLLEKGNTLTRTQAVSTRKPYVLKVDEDGEENFYEVVDKICTLNQQCDHKKAFANLLISKKRISVNF